MTASGIILLFGIAMCFSGVLNFYNLYTFNQNFDPAIYSKFENTYITKLDIYLFKYSGFAIIGFISECIGFVSFFLSSWAFRVCKIPAS